MPLSLGCTFNRSIRNMAKDYMLEAFRITDKFSFHSKNCSVTPLWGGGNTGGACYVSRESCAVPGRATMKC